MGNHLRYLTGALGKQTRPKVIELHQVTVIQENMPILHEITLEIFEGEAVALVGSSEMAKNTLLACILGQMQPSRGEIRVLGAPLPALPAAIRRQIGVLPRSMDYKMHETIAAYLQRFSTLHNVQLTNVQLARYCAHYQLPPAAQMTELNNLQTHILALALALVHDPRVVLLIEPLTGLVEQEQAVLQHYLQRTQREGRTLLCTFTPPLAEKQFTAYDLLVRLEHGRLLRQEL